MDKLERVLFFSFIMALLFLSASLAYIMEPRSCINSTFVNQLYIDGLEKKIVSSCELSKKIYNNPKTISKVRSLQRRIEKLDELFQSLFFEGLKPIAVIISFENPLLAKQNGHFLLLGSKVAEKQIEEGVLSTLLKQIPSLKKKNFSRWVLLDFLRSLSAPQPPSITYPEFYIRTLKDYCTNSSIPYEHISFCSNIQTLPSKTRILNLYTFWSLRPFIQAFLRKYYDSLSLKEKNIFLSQLTKNISSLSPPPLNIFPLKQKIKKSLYKYLKGLLENLYLSSQFEILAQKEGLLRPWGHFPLVIESHNKPLPLKAFNLKKPFIYQYKNHWFMPSFSKTELPPLPHFFAKTLVSFRCENLKKEELNQMQRKVKHFIFIKWCGEKIKSFKLSQTPLINPSLPFLKIYLPGWKLAQQIWGPFSKPFSLSSLKQWSYGKTISKAQYTKVASFVDIVTAYYCPQGHCFHSQK